MNKEQLNDLRLELAVEAKNGVDFMLAAGTIWLIIALIWTLPYSTTDRSVLTFIAGGLMLPLAWGLSKVLRTNWTVKHNPLQPLGLWLNLAQLFYFPILLFIFSRYPDHFVMTYVIITGAHLFPYAWFYREWAYGVMAGLSTVTAMWMGLSFEPSQIHFIPLFMSAALFILALWLYRSFLLKRNNFKTATQNYK